MSKSLIKLFSAVCLLAIAAVGSIKALPAPSEHDLYALELSFELMSPEDREFYESHHFDLNHLKESFANVFATSRAPETRCSDEAIKAAREAFYEFTPLTKNQGEKIPWGLQIVFNHLKHRATECLPIYIPTIRDLPFDYKVKMELSNILNWELMAGYRKESKSKFDSGIGNWSRRLGELLAKRVLESKGLTLRDTIDVELFKKIFKEQVVNKCLTLDKGTEKWAKNVFYLTAAVDFTLEPNLYMNSFDKDDFLLINLCGQFISNGIPKTALMPFKLM